MKVIRSKRYKTDYNNATGLARCDFCGFAVNGGSLRKYMQYPGAPMPNYNIPQKFMQPGDVMGEGNPRWNGFMVCCKCFDVPNPQSMYVAPKGDPFKADGDRPMPSLVPQVNTIISTDNQIPLITDDQQDTFET